MSVEPGAAVIKLEVKDNTEEGIQSATQKLKDLGETTNRVKPIEQILSSGVSSGLGFTGLAAISGGLSGLFDATGKAGAALNKATQALGGISQSASAWRAGDVSSRVLI